MMTIVQKPSPINLSGNLPSFIMFSDDPFNFVIKKGNISLLSGSYTPGGDRKVTIDVKDVIEFSLSFQFRDILETYTQDTLIDTFYAYINDELICNFEVIKGGISNFGMTPQTFLQQHFLTWQPREKRVSYSSPEYLTYYAVTDCRIKLKAYMSTVDAIEMVISELQQGKVYTIPVMYAVVAGKLNAYPAYYDIWVESADGSVRYSYIQRFVYEQGKSEQEEYIIFENSLGGVDCFRAYGNTVFNADNTHNIAIIDDQLNEYRIDTEYKYTKNTGYLTKYEAEWLKDFFPSTGKYIFRNNILRKIVLTEDNVSSSEQESVNSYEFTYRYADDNIYLNLPVYQNSKKLISPMSLNVDNVEKSLGLEPRLAEFPMQKLSEGSLIPVQEPFSERWNATNAGAIANYIIEKINSLTDGRLLDNRFKGYYLTETSLKESYPNPLKGDSAWVGEPFPGVVYTVENGKWKTSGKAPDFGDINLEDYATKEDLAAQDSKLTELSSLSCIAPLLDMYIDYTKKQIKISTGCRIISPNGKLIVGGSHYLSQKGATIDISSILDAGILAYSSIFLLVKTENSEESPAAIAIGQTGNGTNASSLYLSEKIKEGYYVLAVFRNEKNEYCKVNAQYYYVDGVKIYNTVSETFKNKTYEILVIGNSYSYFGSRFLPRVADSLGIDANITLIGNSGQNFQYNLTKAKEDGLCNYYGYTTSDKVVINQQNQNGIKTIKEVLQSKRYDYIVLHQASASASDYSTYQPYLHDFISWIKENMLVEYTEFLLQQTWTYGISNYDDREAQRNKMDDIVSAYKQAALLELQYKMLKKPNWENIMTL